MFNKLFNKLFFCLIVLFAGVAMADQTNDITVATFNVSMESTNYLPRGENGDNTVLASILANGDNPQIKNIAAIIQRVRPDVLLLNEFDYIADPAQGIQAFVKHYLNQSQSGSESINYPYFYYSTVNTGQPSPFDLDNDGEATGVGADAWGFGFYPGQYGMAILSKYPIDSANIRTFQHFKWRDMPGFMATKKADGSPWYSNEAWQQMPLSSKSHWDVPVIINNRRVHILASHPTPPVFDGPENRNGIRNHDEIRFWLDYLTPANAGYIYDDNGNKGGLTENTRFVLMGDLNASADGDGDAINSAIKALVTHQRINQRFTPASVGAAQNTPEKAHAKYHTAAWRMRADYVLASDFGFNITDGAVFWPANTEADYAMVGTRGASSDHRLVWLKLILSAD
jgi:endonuclease/exonuclease/phosphatase family metal-dependent hydrolase